MNEQAAKPAAKLPVPALEKSIEVRATPERAFQAFTAEMARWWPLATHSVAQAKAKSCAIEPWVGGRVFETDQAGNTHVWGQVTRWQPPLGVKAGGFAMTWHPGRGPESAQRVAVNFAAAPAGTKVTLIHDGWEVLAERAEGARANYDQGWAKVLGQDFKPYADRG